MQGLQDLFKAFGGRGSRKRLTVAQSYDVLIGQEADKLLDDEAVKVAALEAVQENGIVFLDEIDKICARADARGADVSREGVQRDLAAADRGHDGFHQIRAGEDGPCAVHRLRRVSCGQAVGFVAGIAGAACRSGWNCSR